MDEDTALEILLLKAIEIAKKRRKENAKSNMQPNS